MSIAVLLARVLLAATFGFAGFAKFRDPAATKETLRAFGTPSGVVPATAWALPACECSAAIALLISYTAWFGAIFCVFLLLLFLAAISYNLMRGRKPTCNCFGQISATAIGPMTVVRNVALIGLALLVVANRQIAGAPIGLSTIAMSRDEGFVLVFCIIVALTLVFAVAWLVELTKQQGRILARLQALEERHPMGVHHPGAIKRHTAQTGLPVGVRAPTFALVDLGGSAVTLSDVLAKGPGMLLFSNPNCGPCAGLMPDVARWQEEYRDSVSIFVISEGTIEANRRKGGVNILLQREREVAEAYQAWGTPAAVIVGADGTIATALAQGGDAIVDLLKGWLSARVSATDFATT